MVKTSENDFQTLHQTCIGTFNNPLGPFRNLSSHIVFMPPLGINFLLGGSIRVLWKHFFQLINFRRHAILLSCLSFKTAKCWIQTSPLNRLCLSHIKTTARFKVCNISYVPVLFHSSYILVYMFINNKKIKGKECIYVTSGFIPVFSVFRKDTVKHSTPIGK